MTRRNSLITATVLLVALLAVVVFGSAVMRKMRLDSSSREFAVEIAPQILAGNAEFLELHAHPDLLQQQSNASFTHYLFVVSRNLGNLELMEAIRGAAVVSLLPFSDVEPTANYVLDVVFSQGAASIEMALVYTQDQWLVQAFEVVADQLAD